MSQMRLIEIDDAAGVDAARTAGLSGAAWKQAAQATQTSSNSERSAAILSTCNTDGSFALPTTASTSQTPSTPSTSAAITAGQAGCPDGRVDSVYCPSKADAVLASATCATEVGHDICPVLCGCIALTTSSTTTTTPTTTPAGNCGDGRIDDATCPAANDREAVDIVCTSAMLAAFCPFTCGCPESTATVTTTSITTSSTWTLCSDGRNDNACPFESVVSGMCEVQAVVDICPVACGCPSTTTDEPTSTKAGDPCSDGSTDSVFCPQKEDAVAMATFMATCDSPIGRDLCPVLCGCNVNPATSTTTTLTTSSTSTTETRITTTSSFDAEGKIPCPASDPTACAMLSVGLCSNAFVGDDVMALCPKMCKVCY